MKSFLAFFAESKSAPLYHSTSIDAVQKILKSGKIKASHNGQVSTTRDKNLNFHPDATFTLDQERIAHNQKITPTEWHSKKGGSVKKDRKQDENDRDSSMARSESEESIEGHVPLKHARTLSIHKDIVHSLTKPKTEHEQHIEDHPNDPDNWMRPVTPTSYKERIKKWESIKKGAAKHGIKLTTHG
jgi:hypothetical protein